MRLSARERRLRGISEAPQASAALVSDDLHWLLNGAGDPSSSALPVCVEFSCTVHEVCYVNAGTALLHLCRKREYML